MTPYYKVVVLKIDVFESTIIDERHFKLEAEARDYSSHMNASGYVPVIISMN